MNGSCCECELRWDCKLDPADCDKQSEPVPTNFEKIKEQIASASVEECALIMIDSPLYFHCADCEVYQTEGGHCDLKCLGHCINWLNSEFKEGEK